MKFLLHLIKTRLSLLSNILRLTVWLNNSDKIFKSLILKLRLTLADKS